MECQHIDIIIISCVQRCTSCRLVIVYHGCMVIKHGCIRTLFFVINGRLVIVCFLNNAAVVLAMISATLRMGLIFRLYWWSVDACRVQVQFSSRLVRWRAEVQPLEQLENWPRVFSDCAKYVDSSRTWSSRLPDCVYTALHCRLVSK